jgi:hypothetical protein
VKAFMMRDKNRAVLVLDPSVFFRCYRHVTCTAEMAHQGLLVTLVFKYGESIRKHLAAIKARGASLVVAPALLRAIRRLTFRLDDTCDSALYGARKLFP